MGFGARLRTARTANKITGDELGAKVGVSKQTISHWENDRYQPNLEQLAGLCNVLNVSADWLLEREHSELSAGALEEARFFDKLSKADQRRWKTMRMAMFSAVA